MNFQGTFLKQDTNWALLCRHKVKEKNLEDRQTQSPARGSLFALAGEDWKGAEI